MRIIEDNSLFKKKLMRACLKEATDAFVVYYSKNEHNYRTLTL